VQGERPKGPQTDRKLPEPKLKKMSHHIWGPPLTSADKKTEAAAILKQMEAAAQAGAVAWLNGAASVASAHWRLRDGD